MIIGKIFFSVAFVEDKKLQAQYKVSRVVNISANLLIVRID